MRNKFQFFTKICLLIAILGICDTINAQIIEENGIKCFGDSTGQIGIYPDFGVSPYSFLWSNGQTTQIISGLKAGTYFVTVTDNTPATQIYSYFLSDPLKITTTYSIIANSYWPVNNGSILINASGGTGWLKYSINDSLAHLFTYQVSPLFDSLASGTYFVTTSDLNNCQQSDTVHISENWALHVGFGIDNTACYNSTAGAGVLPPLDGVYPIKVNFDNDTIITVIDTVPGLRPYVLGDIVDTVDSIMGSFEPGFHIMTVYASDGKGFRYSWTVEGVVAPISISWTQDNIKCYGKNTGSINSFAQGSYNGFSYKITGPSFSVNSRTAYNLYAGIYNIIASDHTGCTQRQSVVITQPDEPAHIFFDIPKNANCQNANDGEIKIHSVEGVTNPVAYLWSNGSTTQEINSLSVGSYSVTVTDANKCIAVDSISINSDNELFLINFDTPKNATCDYSYDGEIFISHIEGAINPITFLWSNGSTTQNINSLSPGIYSVTVTDANNCSSQNSISVKSDKNSCIYNVITPNGDGFNDYLDLSGLCEGRKMNAEIFNESGKKIVSLNESNPQWNGFDPSKPPTGTSSTYIVFIQIYKDDKLLIKFAESVSVIYSK